MFFLFSDESEFPFRASSQLFLVYLQREYMTLTFILFPNFNTVHTSSIKNNWHVS